MGIGKDIAMELVFQGAQVVLNGRNPEKLHNTETELRRMGYEVTAFIAVVRHPSQCEYLINETVKTYGQLDILISNAEVSCRGSVEHMAISNFKISAETNYTGAAYLSKYALHI